MRRRWAAFDCCVDALGARWRCFAAARNSERLPVCERISERLDDPDARAWTDVSAWFWDAPFGRGGSWWAVTVVTPLSTKGGA